MSQFAIFKEGYSTIIDANSIEDILLDSSILKVELIKETLNFKSTELSEEEEEYYEQFFEEYDNENDFLIEEKIKKLINFSNKNFNTMSTWDKNFIYGIKRNFKNNILSTKQNEKLNKLFIKYGISA